MKMVSDVQEHLSTVANNTLANKLLMIYILHSFILVPIYFKPYWKIKLWCTIYVVHFGALKILYLFVYA